MMSSLGFRIRKARERANLKQIEAAKKLGITNGALSGYERDYRKPEPEMLAQMAKLYHVSTDYLLDVESEPKNDIPKSLAFDNLAGLTEEELSKVNDYITIIKRHREEIDKIEKEFRGDE